MIKIPDPSMSVNSPELMAYRLFNTRIVDEYVTPFWLATNIKSIAVNCPGGRLATLVINCHGFVNEKQEFVGLDIGTGLYKTDIGPNFDRLKGLIDVIHIPACKAAAGSSGRAFCAELARITQATVFAADSYQSVGWTDAAAVASGGCIDNYEGQVYKFGNSSPPEAVSF